MTNLADFAVEEALDSVLRAPREDNELRLVKGWFVRQTRTMPITLDQIVEEAKEMPAEVVAELVDRIMAARHGAAEPAAAAAWKAEIDRRIAEIEAGKVRGVPIEESLARARKIAGV